MTKTKTVILRSTAPATVVEINRQEARGWAVHLITLIDEGYMVVFGQEVERPGGRL